MSDARLIMEPKIAVQIAKALQGHEGNVTINLNMNATQTQYGGESKVEDCYMAKPEDLDLLALMESLPQPRLKNFISHIYHLAFVKFGKNRSQASQWLGVNYRTAYRRSVLLVGNKESEFEEQPLQLENEL